MHVEGSVDQSGDPCQLVILFQNRVEARIILAADDLRAGCSIHMHGGRRLFVHESRALTGDGHETRRNEEFVDIKVALVTMLEERDRREGHEFRTTEPSV